MVVQYLCVVGMHAAHPLHRLGSVRVLDNSGVWLKGWTSDIKLFLGNHGIAIAALLVLSGLTGLFAAITPLREIEATYSLLWRWFALSAAVCLTWLICVITENMVLACVGFATRSRFWQLWLYAAALESYLAPIVTLSLALAFWRDFVSAESGEKGVEEIDGALIALIIINGIFILKQLAVTSLYWSVDTKHFLQRLHNATVNEKILSRISHRIDPNRRNSDASDQSQELNSSERIPQILRQMTQIHRDAMIPLSSNAVPKHSSGSEQDVDGDADIEIESLKTERQAEKFALKLFKHMDVADKGFVEIRDFEFFCRNTSEVELFFLKFAQGSSMEPLKMDDVPIPYHIPYETFKASVLRMRNQRLALSTDLRSASAVTSVLNSLITALAWISVPFVFAGVYGASLNTIVITTTSLLVSFSFAFGPSISRVVDSVYFLISTKPYKVGDRIKMGGVAGDTVIVQEITLRTTKVVTLDNMCLYIPNHVLSNQPLANLNETANATVVLKFQIGIETEIDAIDRLELSVRSFLSDNREHWRVSSLAIFLESVDNQNKLNYSVWIGSRFKFQDGLALGLAKSKLLSYIIREMNRLEIQYKLPEQPVTLTRAGEFV